MEGWEGRENCRQCDYKRGQVGRERVTPSRRGWGWQRLWKSCELAEVRGDGAGAVLLITLGTLIVDQRSVFY